MLWLSCPDKTERQVPLFTMNKITQDMRFKQVVVEYSFTHGVTKAAMWKIGTFEPTLSI